MNWTKRIKALFSSPKQKPASGYPGSSGKFGSPAGGPPMSGNSANVNENSNAFNSALQAGFPGSSGEFGSPAGGPPMSGSDS